MSNNSKIKYISTETDIHVKFRGKQFPVCYIYKQDGYVRKNTN